MAGQAQFCRDEAPVYVAPIGSEPPLRNGHGQNQGCRVYSEPTNRQTRIYAARRHAKLRRKYFV